MSFIMSCPINYNTFVRWDKALDYIPGLSTISNSVDIFLKCAIPCLLISEDTNSYTAHIVNKSIMRSIILLIPFLGNIIVIVLDLIICCIKSKEIVTEDRTSTRVEVAPGAKVFQFSQKEREELVIYKSKTDQGGVAVTETDLQANSDIQDIEYCKKKLSIFKGIKGEFNLLLEFPETYRTDFIEDSDLDISSSHIDKVEEYYRKIQKWLLGVRKDADLFAKKYREADLLPEELIEIDKRICKLIEKIESRYSKFCDSPSLLGLPIEYQKDIVKLRDEWKKVTEATKPWDEVKEAFWRFNQFCCSILTKYRKIDPESGLQIEEIPSILADQVRRFKGHFTEIECIYRDTYRTEISQFNHNTLLQELRKYLTIDANIYLSEQELIEQSMHEIGRYGKETYHTMEISIILSLPQLYMNLS